MMNYNKYIRSLFDYAKEIGCEYVEIVHIQFEKTQFNIIYREIDNHTIASTEGISLSVKRKTKIGCVYTEYFENPEELVLHAFENAEHNDEEGEEIIKGNCIYIQKNKYCELVDVSYSNKVTLAKSLETAVINKEIPGIQILSTMYNTKKRIVSIYNSNGMYLKQIYNTGYLSINVLLEKDGNKYLGLSYLSCNHPIDIDKCANDVVNKTLARVESISPVSGIYNVVIKNEIMAKVLQWISPIFSAEKTYIGLSTLRDKENKMIAAPLLSIIDDPFMPINCHKYDEEGTPSIKKYIIKKGRLITLLYNVKMGHKMGKPSTANGYGDGDGATISIYPTNMYINKGKTSLENLLKMVDVAIVINDVTGLNSGLNTTSGDFSLPVKGFLVTEGKSTPVEQFTIAGNIYELFKSVIAVGNDMYFGIPVATSVFGSPSILFSGLSISGKG